MGVRSLQTFICKEVPNGYVEVNIGDEINLWKRQNNGASPILIFDVMGFFRNISCCKLDVIFGGRHQMELDLCEKFFFKLKNHGANLVFFCDGPLQCHKIQVWASRNNDEYKRSISVFDLLRENTVDHIVKNSTIYLPLIKTLIYGFLHIAGKYGNIHISVNNECDGEIAQYATSNNALAVIANDTDFLIYEGNWKYWSSAHINFDTLVTMEYSRTALRSFLGLSTQQLALLATLSGNDFVKYEDLKAFHYSLRSNYNKFICVARVVRCFGELPQNISEVDFNKIAKRCFGRSDENNVKLIRDSIMSYDLDFPITVPKDPLLYKAHQGDWNIYSILADLPFRIVLSYFDLRNSDFMPYVDIVLPLVRKKMGILLQHKEDSSLTRSVRTKVSHDMPYTELTIYPDYPTIIVPDLLELTYNSDNTDLNEIRWTLIKWIVFANKEQSYDIECIKSSYNVAILAVNYLVKLNQITIREADAILITVDEAHKKQIPKQLLYPQYADNRTIMIAHLYTKVHNHIFRCFISVGLTKYSDYLVFDGVYFHNLIETFKKKTGDVYANSIKQIQKYRIYTSI